MQKKHGRGAPDVSVIRSRAGRASRGGCYAEFVAEARKKPDPRSRALSNAEARRIGESLKPLPPELRQPEGTTILTFLPRVKRRGGSKP